MADAVGVVVRERLLPRLHAAVTHRLTVVVADAGFGKTELLEQWLRVRHRDAAHLVRPGQRDVSGIATALVDALRGPSPDAAAQLALVISARPHEPEALAGMLCSALAAQPGFPVLLVVDNAHTLGGPAQRLLAALVRQAPATLHLLVLTRQELPFTTERLPDPVQRFDATDLGFDDEEMTKLVISVVGDDEHVPAVRAFLGRWPAAVRMAAEKLAQVPADRRTSELVRLRTHGERGLLELAHEVINGESDRNRRLAQVVAPYDAFSAELAEALGCESAKETVEELANRGILVRLGFDGVQYYAFPRLLREFVRATQQLSAEERPQLVRTAGQWFEEHGQPEGALRCALDLQDSPWMARLLARHGRDLVASGRDARVLAALPLVADEDRDAALDELEGSLFDDRGDHVRALALYERAAARPGDPSPSLAYRTGYLHYFRGNLDRALVAFRSARPDPGSADAVVLSAWQATVLWAQGEPALAQQLADEALDLAQQIDDPRALAAAHTIRAMLHAHRGERPQSHAHYDDALRNAELSGDVLQIVRIRNNRAAAFIEESRLDEALPELEVAIELAQAAGLTFYLSAALTNRGEVRFHKGQYDGAVADLERARELDRVAGTSSSATRIYLGHVYRHRGYANAARVAYDQVLAAGHSTGDATLIVPSLCGLAQLLAEPEPARAHELVSEALTYDAGVNNVLLLATAGWVAHARGDAEAATGYATQAREEAVARRDRLGEAEALVLLALCDPARALDLLAAAQQLLTDGGAPVWLARVRLEQARRMPPAEAVAVVREVADLAATLGARNLADRAAALLHDLDAGDHAAPVEVLTLGGFRLRRAGRVLGAGGWPDEGAPALLKRLTSVPSLRWTRAAAQRSLWPTAQADEGALLLSQAVDDLRAVLDPEGALGPEHFVVLGETVSLHHVEVDVHAFLEESQRGLAGDDALLRRAESRYSGDYLEEHPGESWAVRLREEARGRYVEVARALTAAAVRDGEFDAAARYSRRVLERDPYDEGAHLALVAALVASGRSAEARSCYSAYVMRVDELGLEAVPWAQVSATVPAA